MSTLAPSTSTAPVDTQVNVEVLADVLAAHDGRLRGLALRLLGDRDLVDDALQEAYLRALRALPRFRGESSLATWLSHIVHNICIDELRRRRRRAEDSIDESSAEVGSTDTDPGDLGVGRADLIAGLAALTTDQRAAVVLVDGYGMGYRSAGQMLGVPPGTVGSRAFRARAVLRQTLAVDAA